MKPANIEANATLKLKYPNHRFVEFVDFRVCIVLPHENAYCRFTQALTA
jgi:hypothetical protein